MHIGVFILLLLSGERNFGVRLNKPYTATVPMDIPVFTGSHADLLVTVFHKIIATGHQRLQPLFDCLLTILVNGKWMTDNPYVLVKIIFIFMVFQYRRTSRHCPW